MIRFRKNTGVHPAPASHRSGAKRVHPAPASHRSGAGFTLVELLISSGIFVILISLASGAFINALRTQRIITSLSEDMNNVSFTIEQIAREVRVGFLFSGGGDTLRFTNSDAVNVSYSLSDGGIERCEENDCSIITAPDVEVESLEFILQGENQGDGEPPRVTILITVVGEKDIKVNMQTTISSRNLDS